jgi:GNAT superfamily N-acetyltransferase
VSGRPELHFRLAEPADLDRLQAIRRAAFAPVFASFRSLLGDDIYEIAQRGDEEAQGELLGSMMAAGSGWEVHVAEADHAIVGFMAIRCDRDTFVGEIGLNAVDPVHAGNGVGTAMYELAVTRMKEEGMKAATVGTGGDPSHAPARRAYEKAGFHAQIPSVWMYRKL